MPIFEYICQDCNQPFEALVYGSKKPECPHCHSKKLKQQMSAFAVRTSSPAASSSGPAPSGGCACGHGGGMCGMGGGSGDLN